MESAAPMMLPKGIVTNTHNIYDQVASYATVPADKIWEYWHVYTVTNKKLKDPTARRLENFWWQVWGSDRRHLSGRALARLYEDISLGPTIAPLHGPPNRWEGPNAQPLTRQLIAAHLARVRGSGQQADAAAAPQTKQADASERSFSSSASKPPPPHPILKKSWGPSSSGPRPTARFVSPHESPDDKGRAAESAAGKDKERERESEREKEAKRNKKKKKKKKKKRAPAPVPALALASVTATATATAPAKRLVVASTSAKRRPLLPTRAGPQSPTLPAAAAPRDGEALSADTRSATLPPPVSPMPERALSNRGRGEPAADGRQGGDGPRAAPKAAPSAKALGKRRAVPPRRPPGRDVSGTPSLTPPATAPPAANKTSTPGRRPDASPTRAATAAAPAMGRSQSHNGYGYGRPSDRLHSRSPGHGLFTGATASTTNVAARGTIIDQAGSLPVASILADNAKGAARLASPSPLDSRLAPTPPGPSASLPMARTRSQLTLLLERERARIGDRPRPKG